MPNGKPDPDKNSPRFSKDEIIGVIADDVYELVSSGEIDMTSPEHVYEDVKRIVDKAMGPQG